MRCNSDVKRMCGECAVTRLTRLSSVGVDCAMAGLCDVFCGVVLVDVVTSWHVGILKTPDFAIVQKCDIMFHVSVES